MICKLCKNMGPDKGKCVLYDVHYCTCITYWVSSNEQSNSRKPLRRRQSGMFPYSGNVHQFLRQDADNGLQRVCLSNDVTTRDRVDGVTYYISRIILLWVNPFKPDFTLSSSSTTSRELLSQFSTCSGWRWFNVVKKLKKIAMHCKPVSWKYSFQNPWL